MTTIQNADRIYVLEDGRVCEEGTHDVLMAIEGGKYQGMARKQLLKTTDNIEENVEDSEESNCMPI